MIMSNHNFSTLGSSRLAAFVLALAAAGGAAAKNVEFDANCAPRLANLEQRLYQKTNEGPDALRRFVWIRRGIFQLDAFDIGTWAAEVNTARANCLRERALTLASLQTTHEQIEMLPREQKTIDAF